MLPRPLPWLCASNACQCVGPQSNTSLCRTDVQENRRLERRYCASYLHTFPLVGGKYFTSWSINQMSSVQYITNFRFCGVGGGVGGGIWQEWSCECYEDHLEVCWYAKNKRGFENLFFFPVNVDFPIHKLASVIYRVIEKDGRDLKPL